MIFHGLPSRSNGSWSSTGAASGHRTGENPENQTGSLGLQLLVLVSAPHFNGPEGWKPTSDLTGSGHSVWILQTSRGEDGYELFYDDFARHASFSWQYH